MLRAPFIADPGSSGSDLQSVAAVQATTFPGGIRGVEHCGEGRIPKSRSARHMSDDVLCARRARAKPQRSSRATNNETYCTDSHGPAPLLFFMTSDLNCLFRAMPSPSRSCVTRMPHTMQCMWGTLQGQSCGAPDFLAKEATSLLSHQRRTPECSSDCRLPSPASKFFWASSSRPSRFQSFHELIMPRGMVTACDASVCA
ncbi:uncharacterized protein EV422DRAFT_195699 [Fimicolochytrium jonesii]|uniref:uncharacterized protein n=1 Tax=Fimicolochytrium jonesii TaxID=1396493 RepID=UPI0022FF1240|nr:uncharacterized protein EV422DRAFT_195699 [Fimicolochytrium jonesii]KAI8818242.1 hypothetical protein EV422DRAFT_195699 [Fimicolochytrium jonesii]